MTAEPEFFRPWWLVCADWLHAGEEYRLRTEDALAGWDCAYCGDPAQAIDHVVARSTGGSDDWTNLVPVCRSCNSSKTFKGLDSWIESMEKASRRLLGARRVKAAVNRGHFRGDDWWRA